MEEYTEEEWIEMKSEDSDEDAGFNGMFNDPDPYDTFVHTFPMNNTATSIDRSGGDKSPSLTVTLRGHKAEIGQTLNSTGLTLWRAAPILCQFLINNRDSYVNDKNILELGGGLGLCGILCGMLRAKQVYITDGDSDSLRGMRGNVEANIPQDSESVVKCRQLRWGARVDEFSRHIAPDVRPDGRFDVIMGSDIIYVESILDPLFATVDALLTIDGMGVFILAYARRNVKIDLVFETADKFGFEWTLPDGEEGCFVFSRRAS